LFLLLRI
jgi:hypothetical protein